MLAPEFYSTAKANGASAEELERLVAEFCLQALRLEAEQQGTPLPESVSPKLVALTLEMYEHPLLVTGKIT